MEAMWFGKRSDKRKENRPPLAPQSAPPGEKAAAGCWIQTCTYTSAHHFHDIFTLSMTCLLSQKWENSFPWHVYWFTTHTALMGTQFCLTYCYCFTIHSVLKGNPSFHDSLFITHLLFTTYSTLAGKQQQNWHTFTVLPLTHPYWKNSFPWNMFTVLNHTQPQQKNSFPQNFFWDTCYCIIPCNATALYLAMLMHYTLPCYCIIPCHATALYLAHPYLSLTFIFLPNNFSQL